VSNGTLFKQFGVGGSDSKIKPTLILSKIVKTEKLIILCTKLICLLISFWSDFYSNFKWKMVNRSVYHSVFLVYHSIFGFRWTKEIKLILAVFVDIWIHGWVAFEIAGAVTLLHGGVVWLGRWVLKYKWIIFLYQVNLLDVTDCCRVVNMVLEIDVSTLNSSSRDLLKKLHTIHIIKRVASKEKY
jgi:hypothetical protein